MSDKWGIVIGNYGDVICELGIFTSKIDHGNIIYYGHQPYIEEFLSCQNFIDEVKIINPDAPGMTGKAMALLWYEKTHEEGVELVLRGTDVLPSQVIDCSINYDLYSGYDMDIPVVKNLELPPDARLWAKKLSQHTPRPWYLIQPFSINTNSLSMHWPHWGEYTSWLVQDKSVNYLFCGTEWDSSHFNKRSNVTNVVNKTPTICHMFALAELADGVITTSNSLAHFCVAQNIPTIVNAPIQSNEPTFFFRKVIKGDNIIFNNYYSNLTSVCYKTYEKFNIWPQ